LPFSDPRSYPRWPQPPSTFPAQQPTIQDGINAAASGEIVLDAPGTYFENINFSGKAITVTSSGGPVLVLPASYLSIDGSKTSTAKVEAKLTGSGK